MTDTTLGGIVVTNDGTIVASGRQGVMTYALLMYRRAMKLELTTGMMASRNVNCKTIIPQLNTLEITDIKPSFTRAKKIAAYNALNEHIAANGGELVPLD